MSRLLEFYRLNASDSEGRTLTEIWEWDQQTLEQCHDFIQWIFPLDEPSSVNADAPLVTREDQAAFRTEPQLQSAMRRSLSLFLNFLGLQSTGDFEVTRAPHFPRRLSIWKHPNHDWLRITRVLKSLRLLGFNREAAAFWKCLQDLHENEGLVSESSYRYWREAAG